MQSDDNQKNNNRKNRKEDIDLLARGLKQGNREMFDRIFRLYYVQLTNYCMYYVADRDVAEELVQSFFVKLWMRHEDFEIKISLKSYLFKSVCNYAYSYLAWQKHHKELNKKAAENLSISEMENPFEKLNEKELENLIQQAIEALPEKRREVFLMSRNEGLKNKEIADRLNISVKTVENQMTKALEQLRKVVGQLLLWMPYLIFFLC
ncbi:MAG: RNA polymerase sigma-70 factor [Lentimicrobiaceae bacterium]|jgi:RNA polymerase sigma-70 factor (ECF subfamily)|nr:RNA polymerase sigma-70 factor [Lentimicrobiaceae bacterium]